MSVVREDADRENSRLEFCSSPRPNVLPGSRVRSSKRADAAIVGTRSVLRQRFVQAALELAVEAEDARIREWQDLRHYNAGNVLRRIDPEIGIGQPGPGEAAAAPSRRTFLRIDQEAQAPLDVLTGE
jgi:hypothetical protein